jgi:hypothetical protein
MNVFRTREKRGLARKKRPGKRGWVGFDFRQRAFYICKHMILDMPSI